MASNRFGHIFTFTTWGESHGKAIGVVIDGCPAGVEVSEEILIKDLALRQPGRSPFTSPRKEKDSPQILSGVFEGKSTGAPISIIFFNQDVKKESYSSINHLLRPGHANYTYKAKYGIFDPSGGGRASARETVGRVAAGAIALSFLKSYSIQICAFLKKVGPLACRDIQGISISDLKRKVENDPLFCPDSDLSAQMQALLATMKEEGDSLGGVVGVTTSQIPVGLGEPVYEKLSSQIAKGMLSIPASKGIFFGQDLHDLEEKGSYYQDSFFLENSRVMTKSNHSGGLLGGISNGMPLQFEVHFKPTSSIKKPIESLTFDGKATSFCIPEGSRHDPCVAIRAVKVVEAMMACILADYILMYRLSRADLTSCLERPGIDSFQNNPSPLEKEKRKF